MSTAPFPDYRVAVEMILEENSKVLITQRALNNRFMPGIWCVPAGKVELSEVPKAAAVREFKEETNIDVEIVEEIDCHTATIRGEDHECFRLFFVYRVKAVPALGAQTMILNNEHEGCFWVDQSSVNDARFLAVRPELQEMVRKILGS